MLNQTRMSKHTGRVSGLRKLLGVRLRVEIVVPAEPALGAGGLETLDLPPTPTAGEAVAGDHTYWERRLCLSFPCVLDEYHVGRKSGPGGGWLVAESPEAWPFMEVSSEPWCPRCGGDLVPVPPALAWSCWRAD